MGLRLVLLLLSSCLAWTGSARAQEWLYPAANEVFVYFAGAILGLLLLLLLLRNVFCWYWKINERVALLEDIRDLLTEEASRARSEREKRAAPPPGQAETICAQCGARYPGELHGRFCEECGARL